MDFLFVGLCRADALAGTSVSVTRRYDYDAFGNELEVAGNPSGTDANPFRYCGEYWDNETETYYLRARYYDPSIGRFLSEDTYWNPANMIYGDDPITWNEREDDPLGLNTYTYVPDMSAIMQSGNRYVYGLNNPLKYKDPSGHIAIVDDAVIVLILAGGAAYTASAAWLNSKEGQRAVQNTVVVMIDGVSYMGNALGFVINDVISWGQAAIHSAKAGNGVSEHTKRSGSKKHTNDKHTKPRPGRASEGKKLKPNWKPRNG